MIEFLRRMKNRPLATFELIVATLFVTLLNLASPVFVIQVLNRYVTFGFDGTLITLASGMLIAVALLYGFGVVRSKLAIAVCGDDTERLAKRCQGAILSIESRYMEPGVVKAAHDTQTKLSTIRAAYEPAILLVLLDAPFALLYLLVAMLLSPVLALVGLCGMVLLFLGNMVVLVTQQGLSADIDTEEATKRKYFLAALEGADTIRAFRCKRFVIEKWKECYNALEGLYIKRSATGNHAKLGTSTVVLLQSVVIYSVGAMLVVDGDLTVGALIGVNILTSRAVSAGGGLAQAIGLLKRARKAKEDIDRFLAIPSETESGSARTSFAGNVELRDVMYAWQGQHAPLFEGVNATLLPGTLTLVQGPNGCGKTSFARMLAGLLAPARGDVLADGLTVRQLSLDWWCKQISYMPQEPAFLPATIRENILFANPDADDVLLNRVINAADLAADLFARPEGMETMLEDCGRSLPLGIRKRIALARALITQGQFVVLDEPAEGMDVRGRRAVANVILTLIKHGHTVVVMSHDRELEKLASCKIDLGTKPVPSIVKRSPPDLALRSGSEGKVHGKADSVQEAEHE